ncbi:very short patch repair endonuclease [Taibaiella koreensis]|uniref:very short patch repair endonuclease n=1 Tax=Taibaiella koreensis TaxID=1268548 RepID=UPI000E59C62D|nr:DNA mismatch endonuclease Vsr [Taibaiella koreensis]
MTDVHSKTIRSFNMSRIRSKDTKPEMIVRKFLHRLGFRYRLYDKRLVGKPDIVLPKYRTLIFIHGCFWHVHENCKYAKVPASNTEYWEPKLLKNKIKDADHIQKLQNEGWHVIVIWECELKGEKTNTTLQRLIVNIVGAVEQNEVRKNNK